MRFRFVMAKFESSRFGWRNRLHFVALWEWFHFANQRQRDWLTNQRGIGLFILFRVVGEFLLQLFAFRRFDGFNQCLKENANNLFGEKILKMLEWLNRFRFNGLS